MFLPGVQQFVGDVLHGGGVVVVLPAVQPLELFVGDYLLHGGSMVVQYFYLVYMQLVELFVGDVLRDGGMVMLCSPAVQPLSCLLLMCYRVVAWSYCVLTWFTAGGAVCW